MKSSTSRKAKVVVPPCLCTHLPQLVSINKSLLVVLYLMETASCQFISWIKQLHCGWDIPVECLQLFVSGNDNKFAIQHKRSTVENYQHIVGKKIMEIDRLCVNKSLLDEYRLNQHKLRSDMTRPGVKQSPSNRSSSSYSFDDGCELESEVIQIDMDYLRLGHLGNNTSNKENSATARTSMESNRLEVVFELDEEPLKEEMESENSERLSIPISPVFAY
ncbi:uncharacterized protein KQ657_000977 [Scheffersomyces spartinae]|uniref:Uncharacterized protein n=1 Tax=Scheffersomyces spartinae TaxID=45513 RepID=A0A9P8AHZ7_9ASCO|nr:uncharacterized protein KQ657_000977 [Scheffersomyces spartinae]KAG7193215.1 hypothetical protein KQ657_000977 [Scheffersomyces spartinae]